MLQKAIRGEMSREKVANLTPQIKFVIFLHKYLNFKWLDSDEVIKIKANNIAVGEKHTSSFECKKIQNSRLRVLKNGWRWLVSDAQRERGGGREELSQWQSSIVVVTTNHSSVLVSDAQRERGGGREELGLQAETEPQEQQGPARRVRCRCWYNPLSCLDTPV